MFDRPLETPLRVYFPTLFILAIILDLEFHISAKCMFTIIQKHISPKTQDVNWTYIRRSENVQDVIWTSYVRSIYVLCLRD